MQMWCRGGAGVVQRCRGAEVVQGGAEVVQGWCRGGAGMQGWCRGDAGVMQGWCRGAGGCEGAGVVRGAERGGTWRLRQGERGADAHLARVLVEHAAVQRALHLAALVHERHSEVSLATLAHVRLAHACKQHVEQRHAHRPRARRTRRHSRTLLEHPAQRAIARGARAVVPPALLLEGCPRRCPPKLLARSLRGSGVAAVAPRVVAARRSAEERPCWARNPPCLRCAARLDLRCAARLVCRPVAVRLRLRLRLQLRGAIRRRGWIWLKGRHRLVVLWWMLLLGQPTRGRA